MREAVAIKIAEHLAKIAAPARVKRALDRYIEKKAIALTDLWRMAQDLVLWAVAR
jgi:hypothetical protein